MSAMKKMLFSFCFYVAVLAGVLGIFVLINSGVHFLPEDGILPDDISSNIYGISRPARDADGRYRIELTCSPGFCGAINVVLTDFEPFTLTANGKELLKYTSKHCYQRVHMVTVDRDEWKNDRLELCIDIASIDKGKISIGGEHYAVSWAQTLYAFNFFCIGLAAALLLYSLTLYANKRSEKYLLLLMFITVVVIFKAAFTSVFPMIPLSHNAHKLIQYPLDAIGKAFSVWLCFRMLNIRLPKKLEWCFSAPGMLLNTILLILLQFVPIQLKSMGLSLNYAFVGLLIAFGYSKDQPHARVLLMGCAARYGTYFYFRIANLNAIPAGLPILFLHTTQVAHLLFLFCCLLSINSTFAKKFSEADRLNQELSVINTELDRRIEERTRELAEANATIMQSQRQQHSMMLNIFHDLRNPLFTVQGCAEIVHGKSEEDEQTLQTIRSRVDHLIHLTEDIFLAAKLEEGGITYVSEDISLHKLCTAAVDSFAAEARKKGLELILDLPEEPLEINADGFRIKQALENLLSNACKYTDRGGTVRLTALREENTALLVVSDNGRGISKKDLPHIFERFYHTRQGKDHSGLGLYIADRIVQANGGTLSVRSAEGKGTEFSLRLPLAEGREEATLPI